MTVTNASNWLNVVGLVCTVFLLLSFAVLPVEKTHRHYLSICLVIAIVIMQVCCTLDLVFVSSLIIRSSWASLFPWERNPSNALTPLHPMVWRVAQLARSLVHSS